MVTITRSPLATALLIRFSISAQPAGFSHRYPTPEQMQQLAKDPVAYRLEYRDGLKATMFLLNGLVGDFTFAARIIGRAEPLSTLFYLPPNPNVVYSAALMSKAEEMFLTGKAPYPIERTLLTTGLTEAAVYSRAHRRPVFTPHLRIPYEPRDFRAVRENGASWQVLTRDHAETKEIRELPLKR